MARVREAGIFGRKDARLPFSCGHSVSFPDAKVEFDTFPPGYPRELVIDATGVSCP